MLVLGGGDGMAVREVLQATPACEQVTLVELDPAMTQLCLAQDPMLVKLNAGVT